MLLHLLMVLKLAPYVKSSEDISCIICTMTLMLTSLGAYAMKMRSSSTQIKLIGLFLVVLTFMTVITCILITIIVDCGLFDRCYNKKKYNRMKRECYLHTFSSGVTTGATSIPILSLKVHKSVSNSSS